jgi:hypothetical protein
MPHLGRLLHDGCTLILDMAHLFDPTLEVACRALQWWTREVVQVNLYLTTGEAAGFELHWDDHDVLIVQLAGEKSWEVRGLSRVAPMYRDAASNAVPPDEALWAGAMRTGDVMHIPRGYWHQATREQRGNGYSLHATFGFTKRTGVHWLNWLADQARADETFRRDLDRWGSPDERAEQQHGLFERTDCLLGAHSARDFLVSRDRQQPSARHVAAHGVFGPPNSVVCVSEFPPDIDVRGAFVTVRAAGKEITLNTKALPAVRLLLSGEPVDVAEVRQATEVEAAELADVFLAEGICGEVTTALAAGYAGWVS